VRPHAILSNPRCLDFSHSYEPSTPLRVSLQNERAAQGFRIARKRNVVFETRSEDIGAQEREIEHVTPTNFRLIP